MKVLILGSKEYPLGTSDDPIKSGGIEVYTQHLVDYLKKKIDIIIITRKFKNTKSYEKIDNIEIYRVPWIKGFYFRNPSFNFMAFLRALFLKFDIILSQGPIATFFAILISKIKRKKVIAIPSGIAFKQPQYKGFIKKILYFIEKWVYIRANMVVFLSNAEKNQIKIKLGFIPKNHTIIPTGVVIKKVKKEDIEKIKKEFNLNGVIITFVGRLIAVKGVDLLIKAVKDIKHKINVLIVGDGPERENLENMIKNLGLNRKVIFAGWRTDIPAILRATDIFVLPSYSEGLPIALLEAMAAGKACVVTDIGLPVKNGENAIVIKPGNVAELKEALEYLIENKELREKLGKNAKNEASKFSWNKAAKKYYILLKNFL